MPVIAKGDQTDLFGDGSGKLYFFHRFWSLVGSFFILLLLLSIFIWLNHNLYRLTHVVPFSVILYTLKSGYNGNSYVAENKRADQFARLQMDFSSSVNIVTEDGDLNASLVIPPQQSRVIHHVMPADDHLSWNCKWSVQGEMLTQAQYDSMKI